MNVSLKPRHVVSETFTFYCPVTGKTIVQELDDYGNHRIKRDGLVSEWACYDFFAGINSYLGCTDYYEGQFPRVFGIIACRKA